MTETTTTGTARRQQGPRFGELYRGMIDYTDADIRIGNRSDALELLDELLDAESTTHYDIPLKALRDAIDRGII